VKRKRKGNEPHHLMEPWKAEVPRRANPIRTAGWAE